MTSLGPARSQLIATKIAVLVAISFLTKLSAVYLGALVAVHYASRSASVGTG